jgi:hypothetical protein
MSSDHRQNSSPSEEEPRPTRNSGLYSGPCSSISEDLEYAHSSSNRKPDPFIGEPPPYEIASNTNTQVDTRLLNAMQPQPAQAQGQRTIQATEGDTVPCQLPTRPVEGSRLRHVYNFNSLLSINLPPYISFNLTVVHVFLIAIIGFCLCLVVWKLRLGFSGPSETPTKK